MNENKFFMHRIKKDGETWDKGIEIHDTFESAKSSYHSYLGAYAYNNSKFPNVSYVSCMITNSYGAVVMAETWQRAEQEANA